MFRTGRRVIRVEGRKGKGLLGAVNYLASGHVNAMSFLSYNAGGDGDNVWPFVSRDDKFHYDVSSWTSGKSSSSTLSARASTSISSCRRQNDDNVSGNPSGGRGAGGTAGAGRGGPLLANPVRESLDGGDLGAERRLYLRG